MAYFNVISLRRIKNILLSLFFISCVVLIVVLVFHLNSALPVVRHILFTIAVLYIIFLVLVQIGLWRIAFKKRKRSREGTIERLIPEEMAGRIEGILRNSGMDVVHESLEFRNAEELKLFGDAEEVRTPQFQLQCSTGGGDKVLIYFKASKLTPNQLIMSLQPLTSGGHATDQQSLNKVRSILDENGATDLPDYFKKNK
jgi:hypothetical protein